MTESFVVVGESLVDVVVPADGPRESAVGGSPLNVAVGLARLDVPTTLVTRIGDDDLGASVREHLADSGVTLAAGSVVRGGTTSTATAFLDEQHAATYDFDLTWELPDLDLPEDTLGVHVGSLGALLRPGRDQVVELARRTAEAGGFVSYDPNIRPFFLTDRATAWHEVREVGAHARLLKLSDEDLRLLRPDEDAEKVCRELLGGEYTELVVLTCGAEGAMGFGEGYTVTVPAPAVQVVDTVGAGDSFMAAMLALVCDWGVASEAAGALDVLDDRRIELLLRGAVTAAGMTCSRRGANPPRRAELPPTWPAG
jgi:fructokinase